jgi:hypothetical protein
VEEVAHEVIVRRALTRDMRSQAFALGRARIAACQRRRCSCSGASI